MGMVLGRVSEPQPQFTVLNQNANYEVRRYGPMIVAEMKGHADTKREFDSSSFRALAKYIGVFGVPQNCQKESSVGGGEKIGMTAPVMSTQVSAGPSVPIQMTAPVLSAGSGKEFSLAFILPSHFTLTTVPTPVDPRIIIREVATRIVAVHRFSGNCDESDSVSRMKTLRGQLQKDGYQLHSTLADGQFELARYNPPFTIPFLKTNEIHLVLEESTTPQGATT
mmetsp:Transcript_71986/g.116712  ORF Transcript_71986/g.116712 Transcript_71986/m.116712 type:complete len:223 (-) Transcript_71986:255-923(-)